MWDALRDSPAAIWDSRQILEEFLAEFRCESNQSRQQQDPIIKVSYQHSAICAFQMLCGFSATSSEASQLMGRRNPRRKDWIGLFEILRDSLNKFTNQTNESINIGKPIFKFISGEAEEDIGIATDQY